MVRMWSYLADRRLTPTEARNIAIGRQCLFCQGTLLRLAERDLSFPYRWHPSGYVCNACNAMYMEGPG